MGACTSLKKNINNKYSSYPKNTPSAESNKNEHNGEAK